MNEPATRRRRAAALLAAGLFALVALVCSQRLASAQQPCDFILNPSCDPLGSSTMRTTSTTEPTTEDTSEGTSTTERRSTRSTADDVVVGTSSTLTVTTVHDLLVPGDGTAGAESTTTTEVALASAKSGLSDDQLILLIVIGLGLVSAVVGVLTWRYWTATRPTVAESRRR